MLYEAEPVLSGFSQQVREGLAEFTQIAWGPLIARTLSGIVGVVVMLGLLKWVDVLLVRTIRKNNRTSLFSGFLRKVLLWACFGCILIWFVSHMGFDLKPLLTGLGVTGVVLGFALQETLGNFFSGLMIIINQPFNIGDYIETGSFGGTVTDMDMNRVELSSPDGKRIAMSNKLVWGNPIVNYSSVQRRRVDMSASASYGSDVAKVKRILTDLILSYPEVLPSPAPTVEVGSLAGSEIEFVVRPWVKPSDYWKVRWRFQAQWYDTLTNAGIDVPYDQLDVHLIPPEKA